MVGMVAVVVLGGERPHLRRHQKGIEKVKKKKMGGKKKLRLFIYFFETSAMFGTESGNNVAPVVVVFPLPVRFAEPREQENSDICFFLFFFKMRLFCQSSQSRA